MMEKQSTTCKVCEQGILSQKKIPKRKFPVSVIGSILFIFSILGMLLGLFLLGLWGYTEVTTKSIDQYKQEAKEVLTQAQIPHDIIVKVLNREIRTEAELEELGLDDNQKQAIEDSIISRSRIGASREGLHMAKTLSIFFIISSVVGGLLGWDLSSSWKVLKCNSCGAVVST